MLLQNLFKSDMGLYMHKSISLSGLLFASLLVARRRSLKLIFTSSPKEPSLHIQEVQLSMRPWSCANFRIFFPCRGCTERRIPFHYYTPVRLNNLGCIKRLEISAPTSPRRDVSGHMESLTGVCGSLLHHDSWYVYENDGEYRRRYLFRGDKKIQPWSWGPDI